MKTATLIKKLVDRPGAKQYLFRCQPPYKDNEYVVASAIDSCYQNPQAKKIREAMDSLIASIARAGASRPEIQDRATHFGSDKETFLFAATENGLILNWTELPGSMSDVFNPYAAIRNAGYQIINSDEQPN